MMSFNVVNNRLLTASVIGGMGVVAAFWISFVSTSAASDPAADDVSSQVIAAARGVIDVDGGIIRISPTKDGVVTSVNVEEGANVKAGDVLAELDGRHEQLVRQIAQSELEQSKHQLNLMQIKQKGAAGRLDRLRRAAAGKAVSDQSLQEAIDISNALKVELELAKTAVTMAQVRLQIAEYDTQMRTTRSSIDGVIVKRNVKVGEMVSAQTMTDMFELMPNTPKIVRAEIPEEFLDNLTVDKHVEIVPETHSLRPFFGTIIRVSPVLTQARRSDASEDRSDIRTASAVISVDESLSLIVGQRVVVRATD